MSAIDATRKDIIEACRRLHALGLVAATTDGNISARLDDGTILITPSGVAKEDVNEEQLIRIDMDNNLVEGSLKPSTETLMHIEAYRQRPDVRGVVHAHPPVATAFSIAGISIEAPVMPEVVVHFRKIPTAKYATAASIENAETIRELVREHDIIILDHHGALTVGGDVMTAHQRMEKLEHVARTLWAARTLGPVRTLKPEQVEKLVELRRRIYGK